jgi:hypothetical protein
MPITSASTHRPRCSPSSRRPLAPNSYRVRHLADNDRDYTYDIGADRHSGGGYEIELVVEKIRKPDWQIEQ